MSTTPSSTTKPTAPIRQYRRVIRSLLRDISKHISTHEPRIPALASAQSTLSQIYDYLKARTYAPISALLTSSDIRSQLFFAASKVQSSTIRFTLQQAAAVITAWKVSGFGTKKRDIECLSAEAQFQDCYIRIAIRRKELVALPYSSQLDTVQEQLRKNADLKKAVRDAEIKWNTSQKSNKRTRVEYGKMRLKDAKKIKIAHGAGSSEVPLLKKERYERKVGANEEPIKRKDRNNHKDRVRGKMEKLEEANEWLQKIIPDWR